jgi:hypothetical protein
MKMPRLRDELLNIAVYLYRSRHEAEEGINIGGSGFLLQMPAQTVADAFFMYAVTNAHNIEHGATVLRLNASDGGILVIERKAEDWFCSETDDLAVCIMPALDSEAHRCLPDNFLVSKQDVGDCDIGIGEEIFVVGRFINAEGKARNTPTVRFGNIAQMPSEPFLVKRGQREYEQESFLVEVHSIGGYSGSPVLVDLLPSAHRREGATGANTLKLLGVMWGHVLDWVDVTGPDGDPKGMPGESMVEMNTGVAGVVPSWKLRELLDSPRVALDRRVREMLHHTVKVGRPTSTTDSAVKTASEQSGISENEKD